MSQIVEETESPLVFPKKADRARLDRYLRFDKLYSADHYDAFSIKAPEGFPANYAKLRYVVANFAGLISRVMADMLFGETITVDVKNNQLQNFVDGLIETNQLFTQLYESELVNSRKGDDVLKVRIGPRNPSIPDAKSEIIIEQIGPDYYFPQFSKNSSRGAADQDVIITQFDEPNPAGAGKPVTYIHKEIHTAGMIQNEIYKYDKAQARIISQENVEDFGYEPEVETGVARSLVFHIPNVRDGNGFWGTSDYKDLETLFFALNNRITKTDNILDKHSDPILAVPEGVLDENGNVRKEALGMFEVDNQNPGFNKPEYIVWNANLEAAFKEIDKLVKFLHLFSEISPATVGDEEATGGAAESGRALKFKLLSTIRKRNRKKRYYDQSIKDLLVICMELSRFHNVAVNDIVAPAFERPTIDWGSGVLADETEDIANATARIDAGLSSRADEIAKLDGKTPDEARKKVKEIDEEATQNAPPAIATGLTGTGGPANPDPNNPTPPTNQPGTAPPQPGGK